MSVLLLDALLGNLVVSTALAAAALLIQRGNRHPRLAHLLWVLVLAKLLTPPVLRLPLIETVAAPAMASRVEAVVASPDLKGMAWELQAGDVGTAVAAAPGAAWSLEQLAVTALVLGSLILAFWSLKRVLAFHSLLRQAAQPAPSHVQQEAERLARALGLSRAPAIVVTAARLSPLVWWIGGEVRVVLPRELVNELDPTDLRHVLAHELAHVRRGDHRVRWVEWATAVAFWWNPIAWLARRNLRANEELCCDALVLETLSPEPRAYAHSLLLAAEYLSCPTLRPSALATAFMNGGSLNNRLTMILSNAPLPARSTAARLLTTACALGVLTVGIAGAQERKAPAAGQDPAREAQAQTQPATNPAVLELRALVDQGELTKEAARLTYNAALAQDSPVMAALARRNVGAIEKIAAAVKEGLLTADEAAAKREAVAKDLQEIAFCVEILELPMDEARIWAGMESGSISEADGKARLAAIEADRWVPKFLASLGLRPDQVQLVQAGMERRAKQGPEQSQDTVWFGKYLVEQGLTVEQVQRVQSAAVKLATVKAERAQGSEDARIGGIKERLAGAGLSTAQLEVAMKVLPRVMAEAKREGAEFELDARLIQFMTEGGLTAEQIQLVAEITQRVAMTPAKSEAKVRGQGAGDEQDELAVILERLGLSAEVAGWMRDELSANGLTAE